MTSIIIKNAGVYDPSTGVDGDVMDVLVEGGKIVSKLKSKKPEVVDAKDKILMAGGVDVHTHIAGAAINSARLLRPEDKTLVWPKTEHTRSGTGFSCPSTFLTGYQYALLGYSMLTEPAVSPLKARHTHEELKDIPLMNKASLLMLGNNFLVARYIHEKDTERLTQYCSWMLDRTRTYGMKLVAPGAYLSWLWGQKKTLPDTKIPKVDITPKDIITSLEKVAEKLKLAHPIHVHLNGMGYYGNYKSSLAEMKLAKKRMHVAHLQFSSYGGNSWKEFESKADEIIDYVNKNDRITFDLGQLTHDNTTTLTADAPFEQYLSYLLHSKWNDRDVELEHGTGIVPVSYHRDHPVNAVQWAVGLELALLAKDLSRIALTTDHPNAGPFLRYPRIISWLMDKKIRDEYANGTHKAVSDKTSLYSIDREFSLFDVAMITRHAPAGILGLKGRGLSEGCRADLAVYDLSRGIEEGFSKAECTVIGGEFAVKDGEVVASFPGETIHYESRKQSNEIEAEMDAFFKSYYSVCLSNYRVSA